MPSGLKTSIINTQERAISTDINRLQAFAGAGLGELLRYLLNVGGNDDLDAGAIAIEQNTLTAPLSAQIENGLLVRPQNGNLSLFVDPGVITAVAPDTDPDSSVFKIVVDKGIQSFGVLPMLAGAVGGTRIDIIEIQVGSTVTEFDSRDEFNPSTGLFTPVNVPKARQGNVTGTGNIRVRAGTPGGAFPGLVTGWLPLAVASIPTAATSCDQMTFWDVRPLTNDRAFGVSALTTDRPILNRGAINAIALTNVKGWVSATLNSRRVGGRLHRGSAGVDGALDLTAAENRESSFTATVGIWSLYLCTPFGLPRWSRYTDAVAGVRVPRSPRGIPIMSMVPVDPDGRPTAAISLPPALGLGASAAVLTTEAVAIASSWCSTLPGPGVAPLGFTMDGTFVQPLFNATNGIVQQTASSAGGSQSFDWVPNRDFPANARRLAATSFVFGSTPSSPSSNQGTVQIEGYDAGATTGATFSNFVLGHVIPASTPYQLLGNVWLSVPAVYPSRLPAGLQRYKVSASSIAGTVTYQMAITGWDLG